jgi:hypothetical protein
MGKDYPLSMAKSICKDVFTINAGNTYSLHSRWSNPPPDPVNPAETTKLAVNQQHLKQAWDVSKVESREDWQEWFKKISTELLRESTSPALRACVPLVDSHPPLGLDLFNAAFISCWTELYDQYQVSWMSSYSSIIHAMPIGRPCCFDNTCIEY